MLLSLREVHCQIQRHQQKSKLLETPFFFTTGTVVKNIELCFMVNQTSWIPKLYPKTWRWSFGLNSSTGALDIGQPPFFSCKSDSRIANVRLSVSPSVCLSVCHKFPSASQNRAYQPNLSLSQPISIITICHHAYQPSCPYGLLTYALLLQLISHFGLFLEDGRPQTSWIPKIYPTSSYMMKFWSQLIN